MSSVHAFERLFGIVLDPAVRALRRLYYCGEWIESHALHIHMLAAPDFLGCEIIITLAEKERLASDENGLVRAARIVPPTSQNQARIEADLRELVPQIIQGSRADATRACEMAIRNYDPCISCSTHFLRLEIETE